MKTIDRRTMEELGLASTIGDWSKFPGVLEALFEKWGFDETVSTGLSININIVVDFECHQHMYHVNSMVMEILSWSFELKTQFTHLISECEVKGVRTNLFTKEQIKSSRRVRQEDWYPGLFVYFCFDL